MNTYDQVIRNQAGDVLSNEERYQIISIWSWIHKEIDTGRMDSEWVGRVYLTRTEVIRVILSLLKEHLKVDVDMSTRTAKFPNGAYLDFYCIISDDNLLPHAHRARGVNFTSLAFTVEFHDKVTTDFLRVLSSSTRSNPQIPSMYYVI